MVRVGKDYDPDHNDWFDAKYKPNGKLFIHANKTISGKVRSCIDCHAKADGGGYLFTND